MDQKTGTQNDEKTCMLHGYMPCGRRVGRVVRRHERVDRRRLGRQGEPKLVVEGGKLKLKMGIQPTIVIFR